jgi:thiamine pyrophosphokinase
MIVDVSESVTLLGAGDLSRNDLDEALTLAPILVAADGGAAAALAHGHVPVAVIGDMDSLDGAARARLPVDTLFPVAEQDSTDFEKCLREIRAPLILGVGFMGARLDHQLAACNALVRWPDRRCILIGPADICFHAPADLALDLEADGRISLFPMGRLRGRSQGLRWPIDGLDFAPDGRIGTSNAATGPVRLSFDTPGMLVILPRAALAAAIEGLLEAG